MFKTGALNRSCGFLSTNRTYSLRRSRFSPHGEKPEGLRSFKKPGSQPDASETDNTVMFREGGELVGGGAAAIHLQGGPGGGHGGHGPQIDLSEILPSPVGSIGEKGGAWGPFGWLSALLHVPKGDKRMLMQVFTCALASMADPLLSIIDTAFVGHLGLLPLASMGPNATIFNLIATFMATAVSGAATHIIAKALAARDADPETYANLPGKALITVTLTSCIFGLASAVFLLSSPTQWLVMAGADASLLPLAEPYLVIRAFAAPFTILVLAFQSAYSAAMDNATPMKAIFMGAGCNVIGDAIAIHVMHMGPAGAAIATVFCELVSVAIMAYAMLTRDRKLFGLDRLFTPRPAPPVSAAPPSASQPPVKVLSPSLSGASVWPSIKEVADFCLECATLSVRALNVMLVWTTSSVVAAKAGVLATAGHQIVLSLQSMHALGLSAFTTVATAVSAGSLEAAGRSAAVKTSDRLTRYALVSAIAAAAVTWLLQGVLVGCFTSEPTVMEALKPAYGPMCAMVLMMFFKAVEGALLGFGDGKYMSLAFAPAAAACLVGLYMTHTHALGLAGVWHSLLAYYAVLSVLLIGRWVTRWGGFSNVWYDTWGGRPISPDWTPPKRGGKKPKAA